MDNGSHRETWEAYTACWSEADPAKRRQLFERCLSPECAYADPRAQLSGYEKLSDYMTEFQKSVPGGGFVLTGFEEHHGRSLARWNMVDGKGAVLAPGASFGLYGADGRLTQMSGFY